nr:tRNA uridine(34) 5-carboxymethylaminomethyl modification radical SAM/GNAT enzyme Elp3 [Anaerolineae bacterium]
MAQHKTRYRVTPQAKGTSARQQADWQARYGEDLDLVKNQDHILAYIEAVRTAPTWSVDVYNKIVQRMGREGRPIIPKAHIRRSYLALIDTGEVERDDEVLLRLRMKPTRTLSGVAPVTVLTKPYPCPGQCVFCPADEAMPKSYLSNEPGAMRALILGFDPWEQVCRRIRTMQRTGHATDKIELLILGGTWSSYPRDYQEWFVRRCFDAMNEKSAESLEEAHYINETAPHRNVGLVIETRPDRITPEEVIWLRRLGVTRVQLGVQTLDDAISAKNRRGETASQVRQAMCLLRGAGMKVAIHIMPNLLGATPAGDLAVFRQVWDDPAMRPDEMKIYPTGLLRGTELYDHYEQGSYCPYTEEELVDLLVACKQLVPRYCRLNRVMRDIPAPDIADGVTTSNLRQVVQESLWQAGTPCQCIRCREVRKELVDPERITINRLNYDTDHSREVFLSADTPDDRLAGFLRLSLPTAPAAITEIDGKALIRQVQVYGPVVALEEDPGTRAQHQGLGSRLIAAALNLAAEAGFREIAVIAAVGTRAYYRRFGFELDELYMSRQV